LARTVGVPVGGVEEVDADVEGPLEEGAACRLVERPRVGAALGHAVAHAPQTKAGDLQPGLPEVHVVHERPRLPNRAVHRGSNAMPVTKQHVTSSVDIGSRRGCECPGITERSRGMKLRVLAWGQRPEEPRENLDEALAAALIWSSAGVMG